MSDEKTTACEGACDPHVGDVKTVRVEGWDMFHYCDAAIACDRAAGFGVEIIHDDTEATE